MRYPHYYRRNDHKRRDAFLGLIRGLINGLRELPLVLLILKLCGVVTVSWMVLIAAYIVWNIADYIFDLTVIAFEDKDEKEKEVRYSDRIRE